MHLRRCSSTENRASVADARADAGVQLMILRLAQVAARESVVP